MRNAKTLRINARSFVISDFTFKSRQKLSENKKIQDSESYLVFLVRVARLVGSAHSLLRKLPIMFAFGEGVQVSLEEKTKQTA